MDRPLRRAHAWSLAAAIASASVAAYAQPAAQPANRSEAEVRFERGAALFGARNFEGALVEFQRSYELSGRPDLLYNIGRTYQNLGRYPEAAAAVEEYLRRATDLPPARRAEVEATVEQLRGFIAHLRVRVTPPGATLRIDGAEVPANRAREDIPVSPGRHTVEATAAGFERGQESVVVASGDHRDVTLALARPAPRGVGNAGNAGNTGNTGPGRATPAPARGLPPAVFISTAAATGVFLLAGTIFGVMTSSTHDEFINLDRDDPNAPTVASRGETYRALTNVSFGLAAAAASRR
ncbi:MAG: tetratricopeptide repeat protein [Polyangiales bacterium]